MAAGDSRVTGDERHCRREAAECAQPEQPISRSFVPSACLTVTVRPMDDDETIEIGRLSAAEIGRWVRIQRGPERKSNRPWVLQGVLREVAHFQEDDDNKTRVVVGFSGIALAVTEESKTEVTLVGS